jgi:hypothetical protein
MRVWGSPTPFFSRYLVQKAALGIFDEVFLWVSPPVKTSKGCLTVKGIASRSGDNTLR